MTLFCEKFAIVVLTILLGFAAGCDRSDKPPKPLAASEISAAFDKAFSNASAETKDLASQVSAAVQAPDYSKAFNGLHTLSMRPDLNKGQISLINRALITVSGTLQTAQSQGDPKAAETLNHYHSTK
jgi:hypothetical protein